MLFGASHAQTLLYSTFTLHAVYFRSYEIDSIASYLTFFYMNEIINTFTRQCTVPLFLLLFLIWFLLLLFFFAVEYIHFHFMCMANMKPHCNVCVCGMMYPNRIFVQVSIVLGNFFSVHFLLVLFVCLLLLILFDFSTFLK